MAMRMASVWQRRLRPTSRTWPLPPSTIGMMPAEQASRRASAAEMRPPVSRVHTPAASRSASSCSRVMVTTTVAPQPPVLGSVLGRDRLDQLGERDAVAHRGGQVGVDPAVRTCACDACRVRRWPGSSWSASARAGPGSGSGRGRCPRRPPTSSTSYAAALVLPRPRAPCPRTARRARGRSPRRRAGPGPATPWRRGGPPALTRWASAAARCSAETANSPVLGNRSNAATIARAWARLTRPAAIAADSTSCCSSLLGQLEVGAGVAAYLPGLDRHPVSRTAGTGLDRGLGLLGLGQQPQPQRLELGSRPGRG